MYKEIHVGGAIPINSCGLEFDMDTDGEVINWEEFPTLSECGLGLEEESNLRTVVNLFKKYLKLQGVKDDVLQTVFKTE